MTVRSAKGFSVLGVLACLLGTTASRAEIVDQVAAIVGTEAVTVSEIDLELRIESMLNNAQFVGIGDRAEEVLRRLIDRRLILQDLALTPFLVAQDDEVERQLDRLRARQYLGGRDFEAALRHYSLTEDDCRSFVAESIAFERYVTFRFKTGLDAGPSAIAEYYRDEYARARNARGEPVAPLEQVADSIARIIVEQQATSLLEERVLELRSLNRIELRLSPRRRAER